MKTRKLKFKRIYIFIIILVILVPIVMFFAEKYLLNKSVKPDLPKLASPVKSSRVLVIAPHSDDEVLCQGAFIDKTLTSGGSVKVILVTNGDGFMGDVQINRLKLTPKPSDYIKLGYERQNESIAALKYLGLSKKNIIFLGYPDGGLSYLWSSYFSNTPYTSKYTKKCSSPYVNSYTKNTSYLGQNLVNDLTNIIREYKPNVIIYPHPDDKHPDHSAVNLFTKYSLTLMKYSSCKELLYLIHYGTWPTPIKTDTNLYLTPPKELIGAGTNWHKFNADKETIKSKAASINCYKTQLKLLKPFLFSFCRKNELFGIYPDLTLLCNIHKDVEIKPCEANKIIIDPVKDSLQTEANESADIISVYSELSKGKSLHIFIKYNEAISNLVNYNLNLIFINDNKALRLKLQENNNKIRITDMQNQLLSNAPYIKTAFSKNILHVVIPYKSIIKFTNIFINANTSIKGTIIDKTSWRMIRIK